MESSLPDLKEGKHSMFTQRLPIPFSVVTIALMMCCRMCCFVALVVGWTASYTRPVVLGSETDKMVSRAAGPAVYRLNYARTGYDGRAQPTGLQQIWTFDEEYAEFLSSPVVAHGRLYGAYTIPDITGQFGAVFCLSAATGKLIWKVEDVDGKPLNGILSSPVSSEDRKSILIGSGMPFDDRGGVYLLCLEAATGNVRWSKHVPHNHIMGTPAVHGDMVVVGAGAVERNDHAKIEHTGFVMAVRISDGRELWRIEMVDPESSPAFAPDGTLYIGSGLPLVNKPGTGAAVYALRTETDAQLEAKGLSRVLWKTSAPYGMVSPVTLAGDSVSGGGGRNYWGFAVLDGQYGRPLEGVIMALDRETGKIRWKLKTEDSIWAPIAVKGGKAICSVGGQKEYSMTDRQRAELLALDVQSGRVLWRQAIGGGSPVLGGPVFTGERVYVLAADETLTILDADRGRIIEQHRLGAPETPVADDMCASGPLLVKGRLYVATQTGGLRCFGGKVPQAKGLPD